MALKLTACTDRTDRTMPNLLLKQNKLLRLKDRLHAKPCTLCWGWNGMQKQTYSLTPGHLYSNGGRDINQII